MTLVDAEDLLSLLRGLVINDWEINGEGMHLRLSGKKVLVLVGDPLSICLMDDDTTVQ